MSGAAARIAAAILPGGWTSLSLAGGFTAMTFGYTPAWRLMFDEVELSGVVSGTIAANSAALTIATLPVAARPAQQVEMPAATSQTSGATTERVQVTSGGLVQLYTTANAHTWISLDGIRFRLV